MSPLLRQARQELVRVPAFSLSFSLSMSPSLALPLRPPTLSLLLPMMLPAALVMLTCPYALWVWEALSDV